MKPLRTCDSFNNNYVKSGASIMDRSGRSTLLTILRFARKARNWKSPQELARRRNFFSLVKQKLTRAREGVRA